MFADLLDKNIQPKEIDVQHLPEIEISKALRNKIQAMLEAEENTYANVYDKSAVVQTDKNYVFFSAHWLYLAVLCKKYAAALKPYGDFFEKEIKGKPDLIKAISSGDKDNQKLIKLLPDSTDRERIVKYINSDESFRPGKSLINGDKTRSTKDIFGSCVLKKISVPDASSGYLGHLIYYLAKRPELYDALEKEINAQIINDSYVIKLPDGVKDCAKAIVDYIYDFDCLDKISGLLEVKEQSVKVNTYDTDGLLPRGNWLRYMFTLPSSILYEPEGSNSGTRVFEKEYSILVDGEKLKCKLTDQWVGTEVKEGEKGANYLDALIKIVNKYYSDVLEIRTESDGRYLYPKKDGSNISGQFSIADLPEAFDSKFARRYITSLMAKPFVILTGNSGTGKTRISKQFAEYLEVVDDKGEKNWLIVPVGADWTDNTKVMGFYNPLAESENEDGSTGRYEKTGILKLIERANDNPNIPYFLILDEMNLSHVERYFSDFLSHMETPDNPFKIDGYDNELGEGDKEELRYPENLFVVGTVNIDETTYMFSPKILDRANVVEFKPDRDDVLARFDSTEPEEKIISAGKGVAIDFLRIAMDIRDEVETLDAGDMEKVKDAFTEIYKICEKQGYEFAYRTVAEVKKYITAAAELSEDWSEDELTSAIDEQLLQKVLPKIHGSRKEIGDMLSELEKFCTDNNLELSSEKIGQMIKRLDAVQYASFI